MSTTEMQYKIILLLMLDIMRKRTDRVFIPYITVIGSLPLYK